MFEATIPPSQRSPIDLLARGSMHLDEKPGTTQQNAAAITALAVRVGTKELDNTQPIVAPGLTTL